MRGSIFAVMSTAIGAGVLSLPFGIYQSGIVTCTVLMVIGAVVAY